MLLYHGSPRIIKQPEYGVGNPRNDYGLGFYCTEDLELAKEWACPEARDGFANIYNFDTEGLRILDLNSEGYHVLNWIAILLQNRTFVKKTRISKKAEPYILNEFLPDTEGVDIICGYRADDSYFSYAKDFLNNGIAVNELSEAMRLGNLGNQIVLVSERAFERLEYVGYEIADASIYYPKRQIRERNAREEYLNGFDREYSEAEQEMYVSDLLKEEVKNNDRRLR